MVVWLRFLIGIELKTAKQGETLCLKTHSLQGGREEERMVEHSK